MNFSFTYGETLTLRAALQAYHDAIMARHDAAEPGSNMPCRCKNEDGTHNINVREECLAADAEAMRLFKKIRGY